MSAHLPLSSIRVRPRRLQLTIPRDHGQPRPLPRAHAGDLTVRGGGIGRPAQHQSAAAIPPWRPRGRGSPLGRRGQQWASGWPRGLLGARAPGRTCSHHAGSPCCRRSVAPPSSPEATGWGTGRGRGGGKGTGHDCGVRAWRWWGDGGGAVARWCGGGGWWVAVRGGAHVGRRRIGTEGLHGTPGAESGRLRRLRRWLRHSVAAWRRGSGGSGHCIEHCIVRYIQAAWATRYCTNTT